MWDSAPVGSMSKQIVSANNWNCNATNLDYPTNDIRYGFHSIVKLNEST